MSSNNWTTVLAPLLRRVKVLEYAASINPATADVQTATASSTLTLTKARTFASLSGNGITVSLPSAASTNAGYTVTGHNVGGFTLTFNGVSLTSNGYASFTSTGSTWLRMG